MIKRIRLSFKLSLTILLLVIPIFLLSLGLVFVRSLDDIRKEAMDRAENVLEVTMQRVCRYLTTVETATDINEWLVNQYLEPDSIVALTHRLVRLNPHIDGCSISMEPGTFPKFGRYFSAYTVRKGDSIETVIEEPYEYFDQVWYKMPHELGSSCWAYYFDLADSLTLTIDGMLASYCRPIYRGAENKFIGVISTDLSLLHLSRIITAEKPYENSYFMMLGKDGEFFIHPDTTRLFRESIFSVADPNGQADMIALGHEMTAGKKGSMAVIIDGVPSLVCYQPVPGMQWSIALVCPESDIFKSYHRMTYVILIIMVVGLLVILLYYGRLVRREIRPLGELLRKTQAIAAGNYEIHIAMSKRIDSVGRLQNSFARMLQRLNFHMGSIRYMADKARVRNEELVEATRLAEEADRQKTRFIQNVSHQIRTPLNIIMGFTQVLHDADRLPGSEGSLREHLSEEEMRSITDSMKHNALSLNRMVQMLFDSSASGIAEEKDIQRKEPTKVNDVARESLDHSRLYNPNVSIQLTTALPDDFTIYSDGHFLMISLRELLYNACKYSDGQHITFGIERCGDEVRFTIEDKGPGIGDADRERVFEPFMKVDDLSEGLGLGLPLAKRHIENLGGRLSLDATYHEGCRFFIDMPIGEPSETDEQPTPSTKEHQEQTT